MFCRRSPRYTKKLLRGIEVTYEQMAREFIMNVSNTAISSHFILWNYLPKSLTIQHWEGLPRISVKSLLFWFGFMLQ